VLLLAGDWDEAWTLAQSAPNGTSTLRALAGVILGNLAYARAENALLRRIIKSWMPDGPRMLPGTINYHAAIGLQRLAIALALDDGDLLTARTWLEAHDALLAW